MTNTGKTIRGFILATLSVIGFASTFVAGGVLTKELNISPAVLSMLRFAIAGGAMLIVGLLSKPLRRQLFSIPKSEWLRMLWIGPIGTSLMAWCVFLGCERVSSANASMADALTPLGIFLIGAAISRHVTLLQVIGVILGFTGALFVIQVLTPAGLAIDAYGIGDFFILAAAVTWGAYSVFGREDIKKFGSYAFSTWTMLIGSLLFLVFLLIGEGLSFADIAEIEIVWPTTLKGWSLVAFLGLFCTLLPFWTWNAAQNDLPLSVLAMTAYFTPVVAVLLAYIFTDESASLWQWLGSILICFSAVVESGRSHEGEE